ncbi:MAG: DegV family protein [Clostridia bacterium]|nr:DegV family protein [Clostridia bacterium]
MAVKILIDSASDISQKEAKDLGVETIPLEVRFGDDEYLDGVTLLSEEFYEKLVESDVLPQTSQIPPYRFEKEFKKLCESGDEVVAITLSSKLSGTYLSAVDAAKKFEGKVYVVDSLNATIGERLLCQLALRKVKEGKSAAEIKAILDEEKKNINLIALVDTLEYLKKGGRISSAVAAVGSLLSIKPVIGVVDGEVKMVGKAMGSKKGNNLLCRLIEEKGIDFDMPYGIVWSGLSSAVMEKYLSDSAHIWKEHTSCVPTHIIGSTIGTHVGPGAVGVAFFGKK